MASPQLLPYRKPTSALRASVGRPSALRASAGKPSAKTIERVMRVLAREIDGLELPAVEKISEGQKKDPFQILISALLSARTQDATTLAASTRLFANAPTAAALAKLRVSRI